MCAAKFTFQNCAERLLTFTFNFFLYGFQIHWIFNNIVIIINFFLIYWFEEWPGFGLCFDLGVENVVQNISESHLQTVFVHLKGISNFIIFLYVTD